MKTHIVVDLDSINDNLNRRGEKALFSATKVASAKQEEGCDVAYRTLYSKGGYKVGMLSHLSKNGFKSFFNRYHPHVEIAMECVLSDAEFFIICTDSLALIPVIEHLKRMGKEVLLICAEPHQLLQRYVCERICEDHLYRKERYALATTA